jgi:hypothetical protein
MKISLGGIVFGATCSLLFSSSLASGQEGDAARKERVQREYPAALKALESRFARAYGSGTSSEEQKIGTEGHTRNDCAVTFASRRPDMAKVVLISSRTTVNDGKVSQPREVVLCYNTKNSFWLAKPAGDSKYTVQSLEKDNDPKIGSRRQLYHQLRFLDAPYMVGTLRMSLAFARPGFSIGRVSSLQKDGKPRLKIEFALPQRNASAWVVVAPDEKWAIHEYDYRDISDSYHGKVDYSEPVEGYPVPKRVTITQTSVVKTQPPQSYTFDFDEFHFGDAPDREFTLAAFGLTD